MRLISLHCYVSGKVQNVFYRKNTQQKAIELGLTGWVRNLNDGRVEVLLCGQDATVEIMRDWLKQGPRMAEVQELLATEIPWENHATFEIR